MKVIGSRVGGPEGCEFSSPEPHAGPESSNSGAASVNPTDTLVRDGSRRSQKEFDPLYVPGMDAAGVVDEIGEGTDTDLVGRRRGDGHRCASRGSHGAYSEHVVVPAESVARSSEGCEPCRGIDAADERADRPTGSRSIGVCGPVKRWPLRVPQARSAATSVQLANAEGLRVIADASPADERIGERLRRRGCGPRP